MTLSKGITDPEAQGGLESISAPERVASLTGIRAVAALLVMGTHAAYTTGKYTHGYVGLMWSRMEIGVPIFFVLSGFLLFGPWVKANVTGEPPPSVRRLPRLEPECSEDSDSGTSLPRRAIRVIRDLRFRIIRGLIAPTWRQPGVLFQSARRY